MGACQSLDVGVGELQCPSGFNVKATDAGDQDL